MTDERCIILLTLFSIVHSPRNINCECIYCPFRHRNMIYYMEWMWLQKTHRINNNNRKWGSMRCHCHVNLNFHYKSKWTRTYCTITDSYNGSVNYTWIPRCKYKLIQNWQCENHSIFILMSTEFEWNCLRARSTQISFLYLQLNIPAVEQKDEDSFVSSKVQK